MCLVVISLYVYIVSVFVVIKGQTTHRPFWLSSLLLHKVLGVCTLFLLRFFKIKMNE